MKRTEKELREGATHVDYEILMLKAMAPLIGGSSPQDIEADNAFLESFVLHVRNLIDFLYPPANIKPDDIIADHYIGEPAKWNQPRPGMTELLIDARKRANKLAAHLTYARLGMQKNWEHSKILSELWVTLQWFLSELPAGRKEWFPALSEGPET
ncbi:MAG: hypothetical protein LAO07_18070 [Acidobacteriia bacterium]|nr:hypothetical protein [Terriglobia bacterium]